jgi:pimeloyl-ACP methyl ester carboxylesterase
VNEIVLHGHRVAFRTAGSGPVILLVHGITSTSATWERVLPALAQDFTVVAPDLLGHGHSAKPRGDYSLGAYASGIRDLLVALGHSRATFVGHSLGGGVVMQMAYQFPELCERLVLVDSGGLGSDVHPLLRAAALPGAELVLPLIANRHVLEAGRAVQRFLHRAGVRISTDIQEMARGHASLADNDTRLAFLHTLRAIIDPRGQRVSALDRLYLAENVPSLIVWGERDPIIPVAHGRRAHELIPASRLVVIPGAGHFPHVDDPEAFLDALRHFIATTQPAQLDQEAWQAVLRAAVGR